MEENRRSERSSRNSRHDPPVIFYDRSSSSKREAPQAEPVEESEMTVTSASESHSGFMIEFSDSSSPKMARKEKNLQDMVPKSLRLKMETSARLAEEKRASRMSRSESQEFIKSPRESPTSYKRMKDLWAISQARNTPKSPTEPEHNGSADTMKSPGDSPEIIECVTKPKRKSAPNPVVTVEGEGDDNVSETGTYTIDSDVPSKDLIEARQNIDEVFGVRGNSSDADTDKDVSDNEMQEDDMENKVKKTDSPTSKDVWVEQWSETASQKSNGQSIQNGEDVEGAENVSNSSPQQVWKKQPSPTKQSTSPAPESPTKGQRSRRLLPTVPSLRKKPNGCMSPPLSPEPKSEPFMRSSQSAFTFQSISGRSMDDDNARNISKSSTKLSVDDAEDTEILLRDTETLMHHLEERMMMKKQKAGSEQEQTLYSKEAVTEDDTSEVFDNISNSEQSSLGPSAGGTGVSSKKGRTSPSPKTSSRWSRLSAPNKHKVNTQAEQEKGSQAKSPQAKGSQAKGSQAKGSQGKSLAKPSEGKSNFQRGTYRTSSLPSEDEKMKRSRKDSSSSTSSKPKQSNVQKTSTPSKSKLSVVLPRQTRSTLLRKSRFSGSSGNIADVSPASSISDLSSSKAPVTPWRKKSLPNIIHDNKFTCSDSDVGLYSTRKQMAKKGVSSKNNSKTVAKKSTGNRDRSRSMGESSLKSTPQSANKKLAATANARNSKPTINPPSTIEAYINAVRERRSDSVSSSVSSKMRRGARPAEKEPNQSQESHIQPEVPKPVAIKHVQSNNLLKDLDHLSKDENTVDDILGQDTFTSSPHLHRRPRELRIDHHTRLESRLKRCSSLDLGDEYPKDLPFERKSLLKRHGPGDMHQGKTESFDDLVLSSINHLSKKLRDSADQLLTKIKPSTTPPIPHPEMDRDYPFLKTENREIAHILHNLRKMERKIEEIHSFVDHKGESQSSPSTKRITPGRRWNKPPDTIQSEETMI